MHRLFPCFEVKQSDRITLYLGTLKFSELWPLCTVTPREPRQDDPLYSDHPVPEVQSPQREANKKRIEEISKFVSDRLDTTELGRKEVIFPGAVILGLLVDIETLEAQTVTPESTSQLLESNPTTAILGPVVEGAVKIWLPQIAASLFIIDGQHRLKGLGRLEETLGEKIAVLRAELATVETAEKRTELVRVESKLSRLRAFQIPISLLIDFDLSEQAMVFADVNFNQKSVSRSFYWDIFGAFESERVSTISFTHDLVLHLNHSEQSPLKGMIKLLGRGPGLISQAFLGARLVLLIDPDPTRAKASFRGFFLRRQKDDKAASRQFASILRNYYQAVAAEFPYAWPVRHGGNYSSYHYRFILCKSMVMSGLLGVLGDIYRLALLDFAAGEVENTIADSEVLSGEFFRAFLTDIDSDGRADPARSIFSRDLPWGIGGSASLERRIYVALRTKIYGSYQRMAGDENCLYRQAMVRFHGTGRAFEILRSAATEPVFWTRIDERWLGLSNPTVRIAENIRT